MVEGYPHGLGGWRATGIFREGGRLMVKYWRLLAPFVLAFVLPFELLHLVEFLGLPWLNGQSPFLPPAPHPHNDALHISSKVSGGMDAYPPLPPTPSGEVLLVLLATLFVFTILVWLLLSLSTASFATTVQYIYAEEGEDPAVIKSTFKALPQALWRLCVTSVWIYLLVLASIIIVSPPTYIIARLVNYNPPLLFALLLQGFVSVAGLVFGFLFLLSQEVAVLEPDNYGLAALRKSVKLVGKKSLASLIVFAVNIGVGTLFIRLYNIAVTYPATVKWPHWTVYVCAILLALLHLAYAVYMLLVVTVLYFSSKLQYDAEDESLPEFRSRSGGNPYTPIVVPAKN